MALYTTTATVNSKALILFLVNTGSAMNDTINTPTGLRPKMDIARETLQTILGALIRQCTRGVNIAPRYKIALYAYNDEVDDLLDGAQSITDLARQGLPSFNVTGMADTNQALLAAEYFLQQESGKEVPYTGPAPLLCHISDGEAYGQDPVPVAQRLMNLQVPDGRVLIQNVFVTDNAILGALPASIKQWAGLRDEGHLANNFASQLFHMSSVLPETYRTVLNSWGYNLAPGARMFYPGLAPGLAGQVCAVPGTSGFSLTQPA